MPIVPQKMPELKNKGVDPRVETEIYLAFKRVYEYMDEALKELKADTARKLALITDVDSDLNTLIGAFSQPLAGSSVSDPLLQSIMQGFATQLANTVFAAPSGSDGAPTFIFLSMNHLPNGIPIAKLDLAILQTPDALTEDVIGAPNANTGKIIIQDNNGNSINVMTCL